MTLIPEFKGGVFTPSFVPAAPETYIVELTEAGTILRTPVIAWAPDAETPYRAPHPMTVEGLHRLIAGRAILMPCGMVHSRDHPICFLSLEEWSAFAEKGPKTANLPRGVPLDSAGKEEHRVKPAYAGSSSPELAIQWTTSPFKTNSFYRYTGNGLDFIFQVEPGVNPPKQVAPIQKIKRDEFMALKKTVDVAEIGDLMEGRAPGLDEIGSFEDDEDLIGGRASDDDDDDDDSLI